MTRYASRWMTFGIPRRSATRRLPTLRLHCVIATLQLLAAASVFAADHPSLVDPAKTRCATCHAGKTEGATIHAATENCATCHEFGKVEGRTVVSLVADPPALCLTCHADLAKAAAGELAAPHAPVSDGCLNCHDAHSSANPALLRASLPDACLGCHDAASLDEAHHVSVARSRCTECHLPHGGERAAMLVDGEQHAPFAERSCTACHRRGLKTRAAGNASAICFACHDSAPFRAAHVHSAVARGLCLRCHDPHLSPRPNLLRAEGGKLCLTCHDAIRDRLALASVHAPVPDGCDTCHHPHAGAYADQLVERLPLLCGTCHDLDDPGLVGKHLGANLSALDCTGCHDPHGSRQTPLIADGSIHPPFTDGNCATCHEGRADALIENGSTALCLACHVDVEEAAKAASVPHAALEMVSCSECHAPHASPNRRLVRTAGGRICSSCHEEKFAGREEIQHGAIDRIGCESCHEPHGGSRKALLRADDVSALCLDCHDARRWKRDEPTGRVIVLGRFELDRSEAAAIPTLQLTDDFRGHPVLGHPAARDPKEGEAAAFGCTSCHDPHKGRSPALFVGGATDICTKCHDK